MNEPSKRYRALTAPKFIKGITAIEAKADPTNLAERPKGSSSCSRFDPLRCAGKRKASERKASE